MHVRVGEYPFPSATVPRSGATVANHPGGKVSKGIHLNNFKVASSRSLTSPWHFYPVMGQGSMGPWILRDYYAIHYLSVLDTPWGHSERFGGRQSHFRPKPRREMAPEGDERGQQPVFLGETRSPLVLLRTDFPGDIHSRPMDNSMGDMMCSLSMFNRPFVPIAWPRETRICHWLNLGRDMQGCQFGCNEDVGAEVERMCPPQ